MKPSLKLSPRSLRIAVALLIAIASALAGYALSLKNSLAKADVANGELHAELDKVKRARTKAEQNLALLSEKIATRTKDVETLQSSIDAFATQAAACEGVRARLAGLATERRVQ
jgi:chromosome segregation ATPase